MIPPLGAMNRATTKCSRVPPTSTDSVNFYTEDNSLLHSNILGDAGKRIAIQIDDTVRDRINFRC